MRDLLMHRLGAIPVFFFLTVIWPKFYFPGPYRAVDKGIAFLYYFIKDVDCIGLDGGYPQHLGAILEQDDELTLKNFCFPIRKKRLQPLHMDEANFNSMFGAFRSMVENTFSELGTAFNKHNNKDPIRVDSKKEFNMNLRLCLLLLNVKKFTDMLNIQPSPHHLAWKDEGFDYPTDKKLIPDVTETYTVLNKLGVWP
ncbi:MAG: hypothetical protein BYD32DRAFT_362771 [Podila humilis]|nr:MAG: hypothetical protein BYD32DRAFT_362771 [Podila humilis]